MTALPRRLLALLLLLAPLSPTGATPPPPRVSPVALCQAAIAQVEREAGLPPRLLAAIGRVESGRRDPETGSFGAWPWAINAEGRGSFFPDRAAAIAAVRALQAQGVRSIDVGCLQINLRHHPTAFASLEEAFEPLANARYAARFLSELQSTRGDWMRSAGHYHSQTPEHAATYRARVAAAWAEEREAPAAMSYAAALRAQVSTGGPGAAMLENPGTRAGALLPLAGGGGSGRGLDAYRARPIAMVGAASVQPVAAQAAPASAATPSLAQPARFRPTFAATPAGMPTLASPTFTLPASATPPTLASPSPAPPRTAPTPIATAPPMATLFGAPRPAGPLIPLAGRRP